MPFDAPVLLYGAGREARSTRAWLRREQPDLQVFLTVDDGPADIEGVEVIAPANLDAAIAAHSFGTIIKSPGVSIYKPVFATARAAGLAVTSNLNLWAEAYRPGRLVIAITGTKGKSTTATLTHLMLEQSGLDSGLAGNVGVPPLDIADRHEIVVLELSSYQTTDIAFTPDFVGLTNLYPEHVDWHGSVDRYYFDKLNLLRRPGDFGWAAEPQAEAHALVRAAIAPGGRPLRALAATVDDEIIVAVRRSRLKGTHNLDNARLAARLAFAAGATLEGIVKGIDAFEPLPHRLEEHAIGGVIFVDDSISTTPEATRVALNAYAGYRIALVAGGHDRQQDYEDLSRLLQPAGVTTLVCLPVTGARLAAAVRRNAPHIDIIAAADLAAGMAALHQRRGAYDAVLLSPGAPSYGQFRNFEERGASFIQLARHLFEL